MISLTKDLDTGLLVPVGESEPFVPEAETETIVPRTADVDEAYQLAQELKQFRLIVGRTYIHLGEWLEEILRTKAYKKLEYKSFAAFLADPDYGMPKSTAYLYLHVYKFYCQHLGLAKEDVADIDIVRLRDLMPLLRKDKSQYEEWIDKAKSLGKVDFINELRHARGLDAMEIVPASPDENEVVVVRSNYTELCRASECIICGKRPVDFHHFPKTKGAGADDDKVIPLCRWCHTQFHQAPKEMLWEHRNKVFGWFYGVIFGLLGIKDGSSEAVNE